MRDPARIFDGLAIYMGLIIIGIALLCFFAWLLLLPLSSALAKLRANGEISQQERFSARRRLRVMPIKLMLINILILVGATVAQLAMSTGSVQWIT